MNIQTLGIIIASLGTLGLIFTGITRWSNKRVSVIAKKEIEKIQVKCMAPILKRIIKLEKSDNNTQLTLVVIKKDLENLSSNHEKTQAMISRLEENQQETFMQLIDTIKSLKNV